MPGKLIAFILALLIIITFIGFNIDNKSDVRLWFGDKGHFQDVPIFISFFIMYLIGMISAFPFLLGRRKKKADRERPSETPKEVKISSGKHARILGSRGRKKKMEEVAAEATPDDSPDDSADDAASS